MAFPAKLAPAPGTAQFFFR